MQITSDFESGNAVVLSLTETEANLAIRPDSNAKHYQWFYFQVTGDPSITRTFRLTNAGDASYPHAWPGYRALASYDGLKWFRVNTHYYDGVLTIKHRASEHKTRYAFFVPYTTAMREQILTDCETAGERKRILTTSGGRPVDMMVFGNPSANKKLWIIARQHAGEPMAEYCIDGLMRRLLDQNDTVAQALLSQATIFCVPNVNPDGSALGNLRTNAAGIDLNRDWKQNVAPNSDEVRALKDLMERIGVDFFIDLHGDEDRHYLWLVQPHPKLVTEAMKTRQQYIEDEVRSRYVEYGPIQPDDPSTPADTGMAADWVAWRFQCPSVIVELPFKDTFGPQGEPDSLLAAGCAQFGRDLLEIVQNTL
ncbi:MAG: M14-type cytosolic carboxypeptidase [Anaerolineae bacterium]